MRRRVKLVAIIGDPIGHLLILHIAGLLGDLGGLLLGGGHLKGPGLRPCGFSTGLQRVVKDTSRLDRLDGLLLSGRLLSGRLLSGQLRGSRLRGSRLRGSRLRGSRLRGSRLRGSRLRGSRLRGSRLRGSRLRGSRLRGSRLRGSRLRGSRLRGSRLRGSRLRGSRLRGSRLRGSRLRGSRLRGSRLRGSRLRGSRLLSGRHLDRLRIDRRRLKHLHHVIAVGDGNRTLVHADDGHNAGLLIPFHSRHFRITGLPLVVRVLLPILLGHACVIADLYGFADFQEVHIVLVLRERRDAQQAHGHAEGQQQCEEFL
ncbi:pentapeptide repeat-containing protein [Dysosmobacter sp. Phy]